MKYFANPTGDPTVHAAIADGVIGFIDTPRQGNVRPAGVAWCADNGCFNDERFDADYWFAWLQDNASDADTCVFATAPDVMGDAAATLERSRPWLPRIRALGYPVAFVAQDGQEDVALNWAEFDVLFIGGTDSFKLGPVARRLVGEAKQRGLHAHMGRVSSLKRYRYAESVGCDSVDGTFLTYGPSKNLLRVLGWVRDLEQRPALFRLIENEAS